MRKNQMEVTMVSSEERLRILNLLKEGKITAEEASRLLSALSQSAYKTSRATASAGRSPRQLRVRITDIDSGRTKVNVTIPMGLVNMGLKMGARFIPGDVNIDTEELKEAIASGQSGKWVDAEDFESGERVEVWVE
jgi:DNA-binding transcriptional ArsR family regulator